MRLICPNCGAQYEVDDRVIPDGGRDVQCSNCGLAWFQRSARAEEDAKAVQDQAAQPDEISQHDEDDYDAAPASAADATPGPAYEEDGEDGDEGGDEGPDPGARPDLPKRALDDSVRSILEEEAALEMQARQSEAQQIETQPDLGIDAPLDAEAERRRIARERMARMRGIEDGESLEHEVQEDAPAAPPPAQDSYDPAPVPDTAPEAAVAATLAAARAERAAASRDVFPDIEEINSTLDSPAQKDPGKLGADHVSDAAEARNGFKRGFSVVIILAAVALAVYMFAPQIAAAVPALKPALVAYVEAVNGLRASIEGMMQNTIDKMEDAAQPAAGQ